MSNTPKTLWFYRDKQQLEVDFLLLGGGFGQLIECKWSEHPQHRDFSNLEKLAKIIEDKKLIDFHKKNSFVLCRSPNAFPLSSEVKAINLGGIKELFKASK